MILELALAALLGAFTWSFMEYCIHRWLGHDRRFRGNLFSREHIRHHSEGDYFAPTWKKALAALAFLALVSGPAVLVGGLVSGLAYALGLVGFYLFYEILHRREHTHRGVGPYGRWARRHHFFHHFVDPRSNHGVTSPIWDFVFRTYRRPAKIRVPEKLQMVWLTDPETGDVHADLADRYELRRRRRAA
ncbi:MAG TPA: sterol desaturase family protein [Polyangiaceae bacterium LLY-WYZ-15_(1-7)]|nr:hypothetical protein [Sandaracinus sp.]HJK90504.1 sterol desaturase family protein [Polyangiaceae bacterium LLY-WYZ-15_(1-7)]MBJ69909.1 hypothetical protein [Sandaracinus sp.]HJL02730.1 sterol desaturase family protein [Polyangiaceae bacterium LLY-WYZ-15_(1-7)]HJL07766.1 sterol desaturase family protein [Polyangiaceae bacterium LLY-WYZ-15_(1-7)]